MIVGYVAGMALAQDNPVVNKLFSNHLVLQRDMPVPVWGTAKPGTKVTVKFGQQKKTGEAGMDGKWLVRLDALKASAESAELIITSATGDPASPEGSAAAGKKMIVINDVVVGDVWLCSGQSNMEWGMKQFKTEEDVAKGLMVGSKTGREPVKEVADGKLKRFAIAMASPASQGSSAAAGQAAQGGLVQPALKWYWAEAVIDGDSVVVSCPEVQQPVAVHYAYNGNPSGCNLYNKNGLPASPFRTED